MKAIKTIFAVLFVSSIFIACENDTINDELGIEETDVEFFGEEGEEEVDVMFYSAEEGEEDVDVMLYGREEGEEDVDVD